MKRLIASLLLIAGSWGPDTSLAAAPPLFTTTSFFVGAGDGWTNQTNADWNTVHDDTDGSSADSTAATTRVGIAGVANYIIRRTYFPVDTSGIPDGSTITAATFYAKSDSTAINNNDNDGDDWINIIGPTSQASNTTLATTDYDQCGAIDDPTEYSADRKDLTSMTTSTQYSWALNAAGLAAINQTGYTLIGMREGHDALDEVPTGTSQIRFYTSEQTGTADDPYLEVTYTAPAGGPAGVINAPVRGGGLLLGLLLLGLSGVRRVR